MGEIMQAISYYCCCRWLNFEDENIIIRNGQVEIYSNGTSYREVLSKIAYYLFTHPITSIFVGATVFFHWQYRIAPASLPSEEIETGGISSLDTHAMSDAERRVLILL